MSEETAPTAEAPANLSAPTTPTEAPAAAQPVNLSATDPATGGMAWLAGLSDEHKNDSSINKYNSLEALLDGHISANKMIRQRQDVRKPDENSSDEDKKAWKTHIGAPNDSSGYETPETISAMDEETINHLFGPEGFNPVLDKFNDMNLNQDQANNVVNLFTSILEDVGRRNDISDVTKKESATVASVKELKIEWGENYDSNLAQYQDFISAHPGALEELNESGMNNKSGMIKMIHKMATGNGEATVNGTRKSVHSMSFADRKDKLKSDKDSGLITVTEYKALYSELFKEKAEQEKANR